MAAPPIEKVIEKTESVAVLYHRLVLLVGPTSTGKTTTLQDVHRRTGAPLINVNLDLTRRMLELNERQRYLKASPLLSEIVRQEQADVILLDNIEVLFDVTLKQDPLRLLQGLSRNTTLVIAWNGRIESGYLVYATPGHPEHRRYALTDLVYVPTEDGTR